MRPGRDDNIDVDTHPASAYHRYYDDAPETFYREDTRPNGLVAARSVQDTQHDPMTDLSGYDLLAARLSESHNIEQPFRPLYRKFTRLNHRILLQLQDEISQMEEDLAGLDAADARVRRDSSGQTVPESRRLDWQWHGSELNARRLELLGQIYIKVEQYSKSWPMGAPPWLNTYLLEDQAVVSFQNVMKGTNSASQSDVQQYRSWMKGCAPVAESEQRFLDDPDDLLAFCFHKSCPTCGRHSFLGLDAGTATVMVLVFVAISLILLLFFSYPRIGPLLLIFLAVVFYSNRNDVNRAVANCLHS